MHIKCYCLLKVIDIPFNQSNGILPPPSFFFSRFANLLFSLVCDLRSHRRTKWEMLKQARRSLFRNVLSATRWRKVGNTRLVQTSGVFLAGRQDKHQDFLTPMQTRTKVKAGSGGRCLEISLQERLFWVWYGSVCLTICIGNRLPCFCLLKCWFLP